MTQYQIDDLAMQQLRDYRSINPGILFQDGTVKLNIVEAYALQDAVTRLRTMDHERVIGFKVGCTGPGTTKLFGLEGPIRGTLFENEMQPNGANLDYRSFFNLAVEAEMAIEIGTNNNISAVFPIIELHNFVFRAPQKTLPELISNNGLNKGFVTSDTDWKKPSSFYDRKSRLSLEINGSVIDSGDLWPMTDGPSASVDWLAGHLADHSLELSSGDIVLGGTALGLHLVKPGDSITAAIDDEVAVHCFVDTPNYSN